MKIPYQSLPEETLAAIIEAFVLQEGTEYGCNDVNLEEKIAQVKLQLVQGSAILVYSELYETVNILPADQYSETSQ